MKLSWPKSRSIFSLENEHLVGLRFFLETKETSVCVDKHKLKQINRLNKL